MMETRPKINDVEDMPVYRLLYDLALRVERETRTLPGDFRWLRNQVLRSSESTIANMREGFYSQYSTEYLQCIYRSRREAEETVGHLIYARDTKNMTVGTADTLVADYKDALGQTAGLITGIERKIATRGKGKYKLCEDAGEYAVTTGETF